MNKLYEIRYLSKDFYNVYPQDIYPELECKETRPFLVLLVNINELKFAIPFRSNITHNFCYKFENSNRVSKSSTALDFSKSIIVKEDMYLDDYAFIDQEEYKELNSKIYFIISKFKKFILTYVKIKENYDKNSYKYKLLNYCTLQYFYEDIKEKFIQIVNN